MTNSNAKRWYVAKFVEDDGEAVISIVPEPWCMEIEMGMFASWPPRKTTNLKSLIVNCDPPNPEWDKYVILERTPEAFDSYDTAVEYEGVCLVLKSIQRGYTQKKEALKNNRRVIFTKSSQLPGESESSSSDLDNRANNKPTKKIQIPPTKKMKTNSSGSKAAKITVPAPPNRSIVKIPKGKATPGQRVKSSNKGTPKNSEVAGGTTTNEMVAKSLPDISPGGASTSATPSQSSNQLNKNQKSEGFDGRTASIESGEKTSSTSPSNPPLTADLSAILTSTEIPGMSGMAVIDANGNTVDATIEVHPNTAASVDNQLKGEEFIKFQNKILHGISTIIMQLKEVQQNQRVLSNDIQALKQERPPSAPKPYKPPMNLPVNTSDQLKILNTALDQDGFFRLYMENLFAGLLTSDIGDFVRKNLVKVMTNAVASKYSFKGMRRKDSFQVQLKNLLETLRDAAMKKPGRYNEEGFNNEIGKWLSQAGRRKPNADGQVESEEDAEDSEEQEEDEEINREVAAAAEEIIVAIESGSK